MQQHAHEVTDDQVIAQAIAYVHGFGWSVQVSDCSAQHAVTEEMRRSGRPDTWMVFMTAQPVHNATPRKPMPLGCRIRLIEGRLCPVNLYEPSDRKMYLRT